AEELRGFAHAHEQWASGTFCFGRKSSIENLVDDFLLFRSGLQESEKPFVRVVRRHLPALLRIEQFKRGFLEDLGNAALRVLVRLRASRLKTGNLDFLPTEF